MNIHRFTLLTPLFALSMYAGNGIISTIAGTGTNGYGGDGGPAVNATLFAPNGVVVDAAGNVYIADQYNYRVRKVTPDGIITTFAGNGTNGYSGDGGPATNAQLSYLTALALDNGNLYIADSNNYVRKVNLATGIITTLAGNGVFGHSGDGGPASAAALYFPAGLATDTSGNVYISEYYAQDVRKVDATTGIITTFAGNGSYDWSGDGGPALNAAISNPRGLVVSNNALYIAQGVYCTVRRVDLATNVITTFAGKWNFCGYGGDGLPATQGSFSSPSGLAADAAGGIYITGYNEQRVRYVNPAGIMSTIAGTGVGGFSGDGGDATLAQLSLPLGLAVDASNRVLIADSMNHRVRRVMWLTPASVTLSSSANPSSQGQPVSFSAAVTPGDANGTVEFREGATVLGSAPVIGGWASFTTSALTTGDHVITAVYLKDSIYDTSTSAPLTQTVLVHTSLNISSSRTPSFEGEAVTFASDVFPATATGTVQFFDNGSLMGTAQLVSGEARFTTSSLSVGSHTIYSMYSGDSKNGPSGSGGLTQVVQALTPTSTVVTSSRNPSTYLTSVMLTATVTPPAATGSINFYDGAALLGTINVSAGRATLATSTLGGGTHSITAQFAATGAYAGSTSPALIQTVSKANSSTSLSSNVNPSKAGQPVTFTATVTGAGVTGTIRFLNGGVLMGTGTLSGGIATFTTSALAAGNDSITANYTGDANFNASTSGAVIQKVKH